MENNDTDGKIILDLQPTTGEGKEFLLNLLVQELPENLSLRYSEQESCPVCGSYFLLKEGRCTTCYECGWSKCSI